MSEIAKKLILQPAFVTIDEMLPAFRGKCSFRQYMPSKPNKYGIKIQAAVDAKSYYTFKMEVYVGTQPDGPLQCSNKPTDVLIRLCEPISGSGRNVTTDNWYSSCQLITTLLDGHNLTSVGTLEKIRPKYQLLSVLQKDVK